MEHVKRKDARCSMFDAGRAGMTDRAGSALILTVVLTSLLAIIGIMFVMAANMDRISTSSVSANKELQFAVDSVVAQISQQLIEDVPGVKAGEEYYDYPGTVDHWLASLEPDSTGKWPQISNIKGGSWRDEGTAIIEEHAAAAADQPADADGDGVSDSRWIELEADSGKPAYTNSGKRIYAAIRIIDNGGMLNVNTGYEFDAASSDPNLIDGSSQLQINLVALAERPAPDAGENTQLWQLRYPGSVPNTTNFENYKRDVIWHYESNNPSYTPFDVSDELAMRNRFIVKRKNLLTQTDIHTRLENWGGEFMNTIWTPVDDSTAFGKWPKRVYDDGSISGGLDPNYAYRHIATTYNMDRIIDPNGRKMVNINRGSADLIRGAIAKALSTDTAFPNPNETSAQITANLIDYRDSDSDVTAYNYNGTDYYGFERPCIYISELAYKIAAWQDTAGNPVYAMSFAIELFKPYNNDVYPDNANQKWQLRARGQDVQINWTAGSYHVVVIEASNINDPLNTCNPRTIESEVDAAASRQNWTPGMDLRNMPVELQREAPAGSGNYITVDSYTFPNPADPAPGSCIFQSIERNIDQHKCIRHLWGNTPGAATLGNANNNHDDPDNRYIQAHPANEEFTNIGEIGMIFRKSAYPHSGVSDFITNTDTEADARVNLAVNPYQRIFDYLTVFDPGVYAWNDPNETRITGRININTAPWYVIAQLSWVHTAARTPNYELAKAITAYRDKLNLSPGPDYTNRQTATGISNIREDPGFESIGELNFVVGGTDNYRMDYYTTAASTGDLGQYPDLTYNDGAIDDFEERDVIFARISNLVTVRSDVFTAYILVRLGTDGPQKRVIAILDRSDVYPNTSGSGATGKVKIVAIWPVPDSR